jgi:uncharacterized membrane protein YhaH (DUF805 family)
MDWKYLLTSFEGRINRGKFWAAVGVMFVVSVVAILIDMMFGTFDPEIGLGLVSGIWSLATIFFGLAIYTKRWHDRDKSGWWTLIIFIPIIGAIWILIELGFLEGTRGVNRFGNDPLGRM